MTTNIESTLTWIVTHPELHALIFTTLLACVAWLANWLVKQLLARWLSRQLQNTVSGKDLLINDKLIRRLANIVPALLISVGIALIPELDGIVVTIVQNVANASIVLTTALAVSAALDIVNTIHQSRPDAHLKPIKGYIQVGKIVLFALATILIIATLVDRSPLILLSGIGAMAAVLMLIFQDTLLSLVASVQISSNDIIRIGDWIEMPQLNADGDVIDIALHIVKVQNWDKTITTIPTKRFITDSFKNWRGMRETGGRRIKRSLYIDQTSIQFLSAESSSQLQAFSVLNEYLTHKASELDTWNKKLAAQGVEPVNARRITNIGTFRAYVERYLRSHPRIRQDMTLLVRQLAPTAHGLPLEIYCFTATVRWDEYEAIQSDIFDHLLAIIPQFDLRIFQSPSGNDLSTIGAMIGPRG